MNRRLRNRSRKLMACLAPCIALSTLPTIAWANPASSQTTHRTARAASISSLGVRNIYINGRRVSTPYGFVANQTTYMPIWYVMQMLKQLGVQSSWTGTLWNLSLPGNVVPNMSAPDNSIGAQSITVNGVPVERVNGIAYRDPNGHNMTTFMPIWYLQQTLHRIGVNHAWDGRNWNMSYTPPAGGLTDNYNVGPLQLAIDNQTVAGSSGFQHGTEYMPLEDLTSVLQRFGISNYVDGNDWRLNVSAQKIGQQPAPLNPEQPFRVMNGQNVAATVNVIQYSGKTYFPIWYLQNALQGTGVYTLWDGTSLHFSRYNMFANDIVDPHQTYTYNQMAADIQRLASTYPDLIHTRVVGTTAYGRDIYAVSIGTGSATAFINGSHHAREWITTNLNMYMIDQYAKAYERNQSIGGYNVRDTLNRTTLWFIPMVNPDGVTLQQFGAGAFPASARSGLIAMDNGSTNFGHWKANAQGIDPNRQYDAGWSSIYIDPVTQPWYKDYKGPAPFYTNEAKAVVNLINQVNPQMAVAYHASGQVIYWEYKLTGSRYSAYQNYAQSIHNLTGYSIIYPGSNPSGGGLTDWWTYSVGRPGFTIEVGPDEGENQVPVSYFDSIWNQNKAVGMYVAAQSYTLYNQHPNDVLHLSVGQ